MMGRYSLDYPGLIYAHSGNIDFDQSKYKTFPADDDGIIPIMDQEWFPDDATNRFVEFLKVAWSIETLDENLKFVADSLKPKRNETSDRHHSKIPEHQLFLRITSKPIRNVRFTGCFPVETKSV